MACALVVLACGRARVTLWLVSDPGRRERALAHGFGHALSHAERTLPVELAPVVVEVGRRFAAAGSALVATPEVLAALITMVTAVDPAVEIALRQVLPARPRMPNWPTSLRASSRAGPDLWPFDPELIGLELGLRRLIKREPVSPEESAEDRAWLTARGLLVESVGAVLLASPDATLLAAAARAERALVEPGPGGDDAARLLGDTLGYPPCCVAAFVRLGARDDLALLVGLLPPLPAAPASPLSQWLCGALALISHAPCSLACRPTVDQAARVLVELERTRPGFAERWTALARRFHAVDTTGRVLALSVDDELTVTDALELREPTTDPLALAVTRPAPDLAGARLAIVDGILTAASWCAVAAADHRAPCRSLS